MRIGESKPGRHGSQLTHTFAGTYSARIAAAQFWHNPCPLVRQLEDPTVPEPLTTTSSIPQSPELKFGRSVSLMQAAALLQVSRRTIYNRIRDGQLATVRVHGSQRVLTSSLFGLVGLPQAALPAQNAQL